MDFEKAQYEVEGKPIPADDLGDKRGSIGEAADIYGDVHIAEGPSTFSSYLF